MTRANSDILDTNGLINVRGDVEAYQFLDGPRCQKNDSVPRGRKRGGPGF
jgi:hypothetical protein